MSITETLRAHKVVLDPTAEQTQAFAKHAGAARWAYNHALAAKVTPDLRLTLARWLAAEVEAGWVPESDHGGTEVVVSGRVSLRFAMIGSTDLDPSHWPKPGTDPGIRDLDPVDALWLTETAAELARARRESAVRWRCFQMRGRGFQAWGAWCTNPSPMGVRQLACVHDGSSSVLAAHAGPSCRLLLAIVHLKGACE